MSQILEIPRFKARVAGLTPEPESVPLHTFRLGYAESEEHSSRRALDEVLIV